MRSYVTRKRSLWLMLLGISIGTVILATGSMALPPDGGWVNTGHPDCDQYNMVCVVWESSSFTSEPCCIPPDAMEDDYSACNKTAWSHGHGGWREDQ